MRRLLVFLTAALIGFGLTATPAYADVPLNTDLYQTRTDTGSMSFGVIWHIGVTSMRACQMEVVSQRSETHSLRLQVYRPANGTVYFNTAIDGVSPGEGVGPLGHIMDLVSIAGSGIAARARWGDSSVWHIIKSDRSQGEVTNRLYSFGYFACP